MNYPEMLECFGKSRPGKASSLSPSPVEPFYTVLMAHWQRILSDWEFPPTP